VCVCVREGREGKKEVEIGRETERDRDAETQRETEREMAKGANCSKEPVLSIKHL
jgi:hypothetical protein